MYDAILQDHFAEILNGIEHSCTEDLFRSFGLVNDELWRALLQKKFSAYPRIRSVLPDWPDEQLQRSWVGNCGEILDGQSFGFIRNLKNAYARYGGKPLSESTVLDFGVGWGRLIRYLAKDVPQQKLWGCDCDSEILKVCERTRVPGVLRQSEVRPAFLPFAGRADLIYVFSIFTHLSERTHREVLKCLYENLEDRGILVVTVRPRMFLPIIGLAESEYMKDFVYLPHNRPADDGDIAYGDTVISDSYIRSNWTKNFQIVDTWWLVEDGMQVVYVLKKRLRP
jgi:hypothetical protein